MPMRRLKFRATLPYHLEHRLVSHWGYVVEKRMFSYGDNSSSILFSKPYISDKKSANDEGVKRTIRASVNDKTVVPFNTKYNLPMWQTTQLERRINNIVNFFPDPYAAPEAVRARLRILQQKLLPGEADYVDGYMNENFPI